GVAFSLGTAATLLVIALSGRRLVGRFAGARGGRRLQRGLGAVLVLTAIAMVLSLDVRFQQTLATSLPAFVINPTSALERSGAVEGRLADVRGAPKFTPAGDDEAVDPEAGPGASAGKPLPVLGRAPEFTGVTRWLNAKPVSVAGQVKAGKVTLIDFWTYTCINCLRTVPYLRAWNGRYADKGLTLVGVHAPEFSFEKETGNVRAAIKRLGLKYPVAQDNDMATWGAWGNQYWPAKYLIDAKGNVRYAHFGEGDYAETEKAIRSLLAEAGQKDLATDEAEPAGVRVASDVATPETYLGTERATGFATPLTEGTSTYRRPKAALELNAFALSGRWTVGSQSSAAVRGARIDARVAAKTVYLVLAPPGRGRAGEVRVLLDGKPTRTVEVGSQRLYTLVDLPEAGEHRLTLKLSKGTAAYAFTFG
ncbi:MAG: thioredoxin family protein, partial [Actinomycetota bacterium]|nr:thioredoxin family protein [Actinomycetota bacterium]